MKILTYFADMLRADLAELELKNRRGPLYTFLENQGSVFYSKAYTPAPDTPRSMSVFFSGLPPVESGNVYRTSWPRKSSNWPNAESLLTKLLQLGFKIFIFTATEHARTNLIPGNVAGACQFFATKESLTQALRGTHANEDVFVFYQNFDYHLEVDSLMGSQKAHSKGLVRVVSDIAQLFSSLPDQFFDTYYIFSDHGCEFFEEGKFVSEHLDEGRSRIFLAKTTQSAVCGLKENRNLVSIEDLHFDILWECGYRDGQLQNREWIFIEDYPRGFFRHENRRLTEWLFVHRSGKKYRISACYENDDTERFLTEASAALIAEASDQTVSFGHYLVDYKELQTGSNHQEPDAFFLNREKVHWTPTKRHLLVRLFFAFSKYRRLIIFLDDLLNILRKRPLS